MLYKVSNMKKFYISYRMYPLAAYEESKAKYNHILVN